MVDVVLGGGDRRARKGAVRVRELRVERQRLLIDRQAFAQAFFAGAMPVVAALEVGLVRIEIAGAGGRYWRAVRKQRHRDGAHDLGSHVALNKQRIRDGAIVRFSPELRLTLRVDQLRGDSRAVRFAPDGALEQKLRVKRGPNLARGTIRALNAHRRAPRAATETAAPKP